MRLHNGYSIGAIMRFEFCNKKTALLKKKELGQLIVRVSKIPARKTRMNCKTCGSPLKIEKTHAYVVEIVMKKEARARF